MKTIFRTVKNAENPFVMMDKRPIENPVLSWGARGVLSYLLSRPDNWKVRLEDLIKRSPDGVYRIRGYLRELRNAGHLRRVEHRDPKTKQITEYTLEVYELPFSSKPLTNFQQAGNLPAENLTYNNNDSNKNEEIDTPDPVFVALENLRGGLNTRTPTFVDKWREHHTDEWILNAVHITKEKGAGVEYCDVVLQGWEANGYPKTREQKVEDRRKPSQPVEDDDFMKELEADRTRLRSEKREKVKL